MNIYSFHNTILPIIKRIRKIRRSLLISKRQIFVIITVLLSLGLILTQIVGTEYRYVSVFFLSLLTYVLFAFGLREDLTGVEWFSILILPTLFTSGVALFYFLLPVRWLTRLPVAILYAIGIYALLLTENIYNVAAERSIALLRAAHSVGFLLTLITYYLCVTTILSFRFQFIWQGSLVGIISFILTLQALWAMELKPFLTKETIRLSVLIGILFAELTCALSFWPVKLSIVTLFLTTGYYSTAGMAQQYLADKLYKKNANEFVIVTIIVFLIVLLTTHWRGNMP